ncbi:replication protein A 70 kDa DNA-binding subunit B [Tanacetum coccineum]
MDIPSIMSFRKRYIAKEGFNENEYKIEIFSLEKVKITAESFLKDTVKCMVGGIRVTEPTYTQDTLYVFYAKIHRIHKEHGWCFDACKCCNKIAKPAKNSASTSIATKNKSAKSAKPVKPINHESKLGSDGDPVSDPTLYRSLAGALHLTISRPPSVRMTCIGLNHSSKRASARSTTVTRIEMFDENLFGFMIETFVDILTRQYLEMDFIDVPAVHNALFGTRIFINRDIPGIMSFRKRDTEPIHRIYKEHGWCFDACKRCNKIAKPAKNSASASIATKNKSARSAKPVKPACMCDEHVIIYQVVPRFKLIVRVIDEIGSAPLVIFDHNVNKLSGGANAYEIINKQGQNYNDYFPDDLNVMNYLDAKTLCKFYGYPDLFITFTCNSSWPEIAMCMAEKGLKSKDRLDATTRVFKIKLDQLIKDFEKKRTFGHVESVLYTIEFQKRGLPHCHIFLWLKARDEWRKKHISFSSQSSVLSGKRSSNNLNVAIP